MDASSANPILQETKGTFYPGTFTLRWSSFEMLIQPCDCQLVSKECWHGTKRTSCFSSLQFSNRLVATWGCLWAKTQAPDYHNSSWAKSRWWFLENTFILFLKKSHITATQLTHRLTARTKQNVLFSDECSGVHLNVFCKINCVCYYKTDCFSIHLRSSDKDTNTGFNLHNLMRNCTATS